MLEKLVLDREMTKEEYKARLPALEAELFDLERRAKAAAIPTIVVFEGWEAAGKGTSIRVLTERLDPRAIRIHPIHDPEPHELARPWMWRFWMKLPNDGEIGIFDTSWYRHVLQERMAKKVNRREWEEAFHEINEFEHQLADDGAVLIKFWLHISRKEQKRRFERAEKDTKAFFSVTKDMWRQNRDYDKWTRAVEEMLERTETEWAPWTIVESHDRRAARIKIFETMIRSLSGRLDTMPNAPPPLFTRGGPTSSVSASAPPTIVPRTERLPAAAAPARGSADKQEKAEKAEKAEKTEMPAAAAASAQTASAGAKTEGR